MKKLIFGLILTIVSTLMLSGSLRAQNITVEGEDLSTIAKSTGTGKLIQ